MSNENDGGPAFPSTGCHAHNGSLGMSYRDLCALVTMAVMRMTFPTTQHPRQIAQKSWEQADAMLEAREQ